MANNGLYLLLQDIHVILDWEIHYFVGIEFEINGRLYLLINSEDMNIFQQ